MKLQSLLERLKVDEILGNSHVEISGIQVDSRRVRKGDLFVAIRGEAVDGHGFLAEAMGGGAVAVVVEDASHAPASLCRIRVENSRKALAILSSEFYGKPSQSLKVVGVTGTNGKTTTTHLIASIFDAAGIPSGLIGTISYRVGERELPSPHTTPSSEELQGLMAQMVSSGRKAVVMEVSSHSLVQNRVDEVAWDAGVFTNLTRDHLDYHKTMEEYFEAKKILFKMLGGSGKKAHAILNIDDPKGNELGKILGKNVSSITYGLAAGADVRAEEIQYSIEGCRFKLVLRDERIPVFTPLCGRHNVSNCLAAAATALVFQVEPGLIGRGLEAVRNVPGRLERVTGNTGPGVFAVFVDYAHTDDALRNVLSTLRPLTSGRLITVFGCGGNRDQLKRSLMGRVAGEMSDVNVITNDNPRNEDPEMIARQIVEGFGSRENFEVVLDRREAIRRALKSAARGDVVLVAGKGHETYQETRGTRSSFDDRKVVRELLDEMFATTDGGRN